jgi:hypothetical protein
MIDDNECADAECDIGRHIPETDCQKEGAEDEDVGKGEDCVRVEGHLLEQREKVLGAMARSLRVFYDEL